MNKRNFITAASLLPHSAFDIRTFAERENTLVFTLASDQMDELTQLSTSYHTTQFNWREQGFNQKHYRVVITFPPQILFEAKQARVAASTSAARQLFNSWAENRLHESVTVIPTDHWNEDEEEDNPWSGLVYLIQKAITEAKESS